MGRRWKDSRVDHDGGPPGPPTNASLILLLSVSPAAGPVGMWETRLHAFSIFPSGRFPLSFFLLLFLSLWKTILFRDFSTEASVRSAGGRRNTLRWNRWGCGSWGPRSLVDPLGLKCRPHRFRSSERSFGMVLWGVTPGSSASRHDQDGSGCRDPQNKIQE